MLFVGNGNADQIVVVNQRGVIDAAVEWQHLRKSLELGAFSGAVLADEKRTSAPPESRCERKGQRLRFLRCVPGEQDVPNGACRIDVVGAKAQAHPALSVVGKVLGVVQPPRAVVVPEVVVRVAADADGNLRVVHSACGRGRTRNPVTQQKTADPDREAAVKARRDFCSADFSPLRIERHSPFTVGFLRLRLAALVSQCVPDVEVSAADRVGVGNCSVCHKKSGLVCQTESAE